MIGRVFKELKLIEQWGAGLQRILVVSAEEGLKPPLIEEHNNHFSVTLYNERSNSCQIVSWEEVILTHLENYLSITTKESAKLWKVSDRTARTRLKTMVELGRLQRIATSEKDPFATFVARK